MESYKELKVWQRSKELAVCIYTCTNNFPKEEIYTLTAQLRRSAISVPSNIAEGWARGSSKDYSRHLMIARGSLMELETQIEIAYELEFIDKPTYSAIIRNVEEIGKMLNGLINSIKARS